MGSRAGPAAKYPKSLCRAVCASVAAQMKVDAADVMSMDITADQDGEEDPGISSV